MFNFDKCISGNMYIFGHGIMRACAYFHDGRFSGFGEYDEISALPDKYVILPGFIDKHIHGAGGEDCMRSDLALQKMSELLPSEGVTRFLPTTMTAPIGDLRKALTSMGKQIKKGGFSGAKPMGIHLEGPFIAPEKCGAQPKEDILPFSEEVFDKLYKDSESTIWQVTYAPEKNPDMTGYLAQKGIIASVGHTTATTKEVLQAEKDGATSLTHVYNAMTGLSHRDCGTVGGAMLSNMVCELICDGKHVEKEAVQVLYKTAKGRICLISDATEAKYLPEGEYYLGKNKIIVKNNLARLPDGTIAGSVLKMNEAVKNFRDFCKISLEEAVDDASIIPARCLKIDEECGSIEVGKYADFTVCDENLNVKCTVREGKVVYKQI